MPAYSLWLEPEGVLRDRLQKEMNHLAEAYHGPKFEPHVTLLPAFDAADDEAAKRAAQMVATSLKPYDIRFQRISHGKPFFQCVYVLCQESNAVMQANQIARQQLGLESSRPYMPHLSLFYGRVAEELKEEIAAAEEQLIMGPDNLPAGFGVRDFTLWSTEPGDYTLKSWKRLARFPLE